MPTSTEVCLMAGRRASDSRISLVETGTPSQARHRFAPPIPIHQFTRLNWGILLFMLLGVSLAAQAQVSGTVFRDFNANGVRDGASEVGVGGVSVTAFNAAGAQVATTTSTTAGAYSLTGLTFPVRIQFGNLGGSDFTGPSGSDSQSSVQFYSAATTTANFGVNNPSDYCQAAPSLFTTCFTNGSRSLSNPSENDVLVAVPNGATLSGTVQHLATAPNMGSVWGVAYDRVNKIVYTSAFLKRHSDFGPRGISGLYWGSYTGSALASQGSIALNTISGNIFGTDPRSDGVGPDDNLTGVSYNQPSYDRDVYQNIGKLGIGDIDLSPDGKTLYVMNLTQRRLAAFDVSAVASGGNPTYLGSYAITDPGCSGGQFRPFGIKVVNKDLIYVGVTCSGETSQSRGDLMAYICQIVPSAGFAATSAIVPVTAIQPPTNASFSASGFIPPVPPTNAIPLYYNKVWPSEYGNPYEAQNYIYEPWKTAWPTTQGVFAAPQPLLSDIEINRNGDLILGITDRMGHMAGYYNYDISGTSNALYSDFAYGDILYVCNKGTTSNPIYYLEGHPQCPPPPTNPNFQGPGGREYFNDETPSHREGAQGGLVLLPQENYTVTGMMDPGTTTYSSGLTVFNNSSGQSVQALTLAGAAFGKAGGIGDMEVTCDPAPIEIGNRVWKDIDNDGIQDAGEPPLAGVTLSLYASCTGTAIATAVTDANGNYYFSSAAGTSTASNIYGLNLQYGASYCIRVTSLGSDPSVTGLSLISLSPAPGEVSGSPNSSSTVANNDAFLESGQPTIRLVTGSVGENNHTYDIGFPGSCSMVATVTAGLCASATNTYSATAVVTIQSPEAGVLTVVNGAQSLTFATTATSSATFTAVFNGLISDGASHTVTAGLAGCSSTSATYTAPASCSVAPCGLALAVTPGLCLSATNTYVLSGTVTSTNIPAASSLLLSSAAFSPGSIALPAGNATTTFSYTGLVSNGQSYTINGLPTYKDCPPVSQTFTAPTSCSVAPCSLTATVTAGLCASATNTYSATAVVRLTNPTAGVLTVVNGPQSQTFTTTAATSATFTAVFNGLISDGASHTVTASLPGCSTTTATYTAPTSCSVAPVCSLTAAVTAGLCASATNTYSATAVVQLSNPTAGVLTVSTGSQSQTFTTTATTSATFTAVFAGLVSDGASQTVTASLPGCSTTTATYTAPASCSVAPCGVNLAVTPGLCLSATNSYVLSGTITTTNVPVSGTLTITSAAFTPRSLTLPAGNSTGTFSYSGLVSNGQTYTVTASYSNSACAPVSQTYTAPVSCSVAPVCSLSAAVTAGLCASATNTYSATAVVTVQNPVAGVLTVTNGAQSATLTTSNATGPVSYTAVFAGLVSDGASRTVTASLPGCSTATTTYTAPTSCSVAPVCSLTATVTAGLCASATNTYSATAVVRLTNPTAGVLTVTNGAQSLTFATTAVGSATYTATFTGLVSDGVSHTVVASLPGCSTTTATYTAPASCSVAPVCSLSAAVTAGLCASATNTYSATAVVQLTNPVAGVLTVTNGAQSLTFATTAAPSAVYTVEFPGLVSDGVSHTVTASLPGCGTTTATYTAPASCSIAPVCSLTAAVTAGLCASATNTYSATAVVRLTNPTAGVLTVINGAQSLTFATTAVSSATYTAVFNGLISDGASHTVTASLPGCSTTTTTYTAPTSCSVAPICSLSATVTAGLCASATNTYSATALVTIQNPSGGVLTVTNGTASITATIPASSGQVVFPAIFNGLTSDGVSHTVVASLPGCSTTTTTYTAPVSCTVAPVCSLSAAVTAGLCASATNTYSATAVVQLTNPTAGVLTVTNGAQSLTFATTAVSSATYTAVFNGLTSDGASHTVVASLPGCSTTTTTYTAPASCTVAPVCSLTAAVTAGICASATNTYSATAVVQLTNPTAGVLTVTNGAQSLTFATTAVSSATYTAVFNGLTSDGASHTVVASLPGCSTTTTTYTAPASCTVAPVCSLTAAVTAGICASATNTYSATAVVQLTNPTAGVLTVTNGAQSLTFATTAVSSATYTAVFNGLISDGASHTVVASLPGCSTTTTTYTAPASCTVAPVCSLTAAVTAGLCASATNTYSATAVVQLTNPTAGVLTVTNGAQSLTFATTAVSSATYTAVFNGLTSDGASHTVVASLPGCSTTTTTYTAPASCTVAPVCSLTAAVTAGVCASATNTYSATAVVQLTNPTAGVLTVTNGAQSLTFATTAVSSATYTAVFNGLTSDGASHTVVASLPGCSTTTTTYTAPVSCTVAPVCSLSAAVTAGLCASATNTYSATAVVQLTNPTAGVLTVTNGAQSLTFATTAVSSATYTAVFNGLTSDGASHTVVASLPGCSTTTTTYTAPVSCTVAPVCSLSAAVTAGLCASATNTYSATAVVQLTNPTAGVLTVTNGAQSLTFATTAVSSATYTAVFNGLTSDGASHTVVASLPGCSTTTAQYSAPGSCTATALELVKLVDKSKAQLGEVISYTVVLTNTGNAAATNVVVRDSMSLGLTYVANSATAPAGTTFTAGSPVSTWSIASIGAGQSLSLILQGIADSTGILHNTAMIGGDTATVCTSIPVRVCVDDEFEYLLTAPAGQSSYQWYKNGQPIVGATSNSLSVTAVGEYSLRVDNQSGQCPDFSCCPFIIEADSLPVYQAATLAASCIGNAAQSNGQLVLSGFQTGYTYQYSLGSSFTTSASGAPRSIPANGVIANTLANPVVAQAYTIRVYNAAGCYRDVTVLLLPTVCGCPAEICVPFVLQQTKRGKRIGDPVQK